ncbi:hypothetical protein [Blastococcus haudaquaticus]|uniref:Uncharacterized protein n=1 Tax=Blastococcus haudaquaticus TaxID=1938745 RepID=A0A286H8F3_9ACTN|nr:hypothetical protein [Blastococcus haudaquaticus]SOE03609.1 hypothetical protein SAMN06272739_4256 [Blastococcus haudaquaticus]
MANGGTGILTSSTDEVAPEVARRTWPRWVVLGIVMLAVAVTAVLWDEAGARLLLGAIGAFLVGRGAVLLRGARTAEAPAELAGRARVLGTTAAVLGAGALVVALVSEAAAATALLVAVPLLLLGTGLALLGRGGAARRGGQALLVWAVLVTGLLVATGIGRDWERAADVATVIAALAVAVLAVPVLVGASSLRVVAARPAPAPARTLSSACAGCACGAGGCGA